MNSMRASFFATLFLFVACGDDNITTDAAPGRDGFGADARMSDANASDSQMGGDTTTLDGSVPRDGFVPDTPRRDVGPGLCEEGSGRCTAHNARSVCHGGEWVDEICASGSGCTEGVCAPSMCSDECFAGQTDGARTCELFDVAGNRWVALDESGSMADRARGFEARLRAEPNLYGGVGNLLFTSPALTELLAITGLYDSAIWTGTYLGAQSFRYQATGEPDARDQVVELANTLHLWLNVTGHPSNLARFVAPSSRPSRPVLAGTECDREFRHCNVMHEGVSYDYIGHTSRDQYQGVMFGLMAAYEALGPEDETTREMIRADIVGFVEELMKERMQAVTFEINGRSFDLTIPMRFVVLNPDEMEDGRPTLILDTDDSDNSEMIGFQEFVPDLQDFAKHIPLIGGLVPSLPRPGSAVMLATFFNMALKVTEDVDSYAMRHTTIRDYYTSHAGDGGSIRDWLAIADDWEYHGECGSSYFATNIVMQPMYHLARLETDAALRAVIHGDVLGRQLWPTFVNHKNVFFSYIYAANTPAANPEIARDASAQLAGFPAGPRQHINPDLRSVARYTPHESECSDQTSHAGAVDVRDRMRSDFIWQRNPWALVSSTPDNASATWPGVDYLVAYWMGRLHGYMENDREGFCLAWH